MSIILIIMIFCHIVDDYYLQGWLASAKQKNYWEQLPNYSEKYKFDYIVALLMHAFSWTFMVMSPIIIYFSFNLNVDFFIVFILNFLIHTFVDNLKANKMKINLIQDQIVHIIQIIITFLFFFL